MQVAHSVARLAFELIADHHPHLQDETIIYAFTDQEPSPRARACKRWGAVKATGVEFNFARKLGAGTAEEGVAVAALPEVRYLVKVWQAAWQLLSADQQRFAVDELLTHCQVVENEVNGEKSFIVEGHEWEGYSAVLERHGAVMDSFRALVRTAHQLELPPEEETPEQGELDLAERDEDLQDFPPRSGNGIAHAEDEGDGQELTDEQRAARAEAQYQREARALSDRLAAETQVPA